MSTPAPYQENPDHVPDPTSVSGTLETTQTGGGRHERLTGVTRIFHHAEEVATHWAAEIRNRVEAREGRAVDPEIAEHPYTVPEPVAAPVEDGETPEGAPDPVAAPVAGQTDAEAVQALPVAVPEDAPEPDTETTKATGK